MAEILHQFCIIRVLRVRGVRFVAFVERQGTEDGRTTQQGNSLLPWNAARVCQGCLQLHVHQKQQFLQPIAESYPYRGGVSELDVTRYGKSSVG